MLFCYGNCNGQQVSSVWLYFSINWLQHMLCGNTPCLSLSEVCLRVASHWLVQQCCLLFSSISFGIIQSFLYFFLHLSLSCVFPNCFSPSVMLNLFRSFLALSLNCILCRSNNRSRLGSQPNGHHLIITYPSQMSYPPHVQSFCYHHTFLAEQT